LTSTLTQGVELDGNVDVDAIVDLVRGAGPSEQESSSEAVPEDNVEVDGGVCVQRRRQPQRAGSTSTSSYVFAEVNGDRRNASLD
jgi:hypothetical protein